MANSGHGPRNTAIEAVMYLNSFIVFTSMYFPFRKPFRQAISLTRGDVRELHCKEPEPKIRNKYSHKRNCAATVPISKIMCQWAIYIFQQSICLFFFRIYAERSWQYIIAHRHMNVDTGTEIAQFSEKEYINGIFVAVRVNLFSYLAPQRPVCWRTESACFYMQSAANEKNLNTG